MKTCLVVDDSRVVRKVARRILEDLGFDVAEAGDGADALSFCRATMPDAILLDWHMPVMSGPEFLRRLRLEPGGADPRVIFCSGETRIARIREALEDGADEFIMKPFDADIVMGKLAQAGVA
ncbi:response regulator [Phenylobacterium soli]|uniref:Response regulator n=1 Tax=Phenylobacterium soli TaxID=2170551 RepID=A0A328AFF2_9CAUL|nr:response regulator [Phenylobacterium soli]RAK53257.1 response regulator [Phenylobacterium soli]